MGCIGFQCSSIKRKVYGWSRLPTIRRIKRITDCDYAPMDFEQAIIVDQPINLLV